MACQRLEVRLRSLWHTGDDPVADFLVPAGMGVRTSLFRGSRLTRSERLMAERTDCPLDGSRLAGLARAVRLALTHDASSTDARASIAANYAAPLITSFAASVLHRAEQDRVQTLHFVARDAQSVKLAAEILAGAEDRVKLSYLYGSRRAWNSAQADEAHAREARLQSTYGYLERSGLTGTDDWAIVDSGWTLKAQQSLRRILESRGASFGRGYYLALSAGHVPVSQAGPAWALVAEPQGRDDAQKWLRALFRNRGIIDQVLLTADHGTTLGYELGDDGWRPVLAGVDESRARRRLREAIRSAVVMFAAEAKQHPSLDLSGGSVRQAILSVVCDFIARPSRNQARVLSLLEVSLDAAESGSVQLCRPLSPRALWRIAVSAAAQLMRGTAAHIEPGRRVREGSILGRVLARRLRGFVRSRRSCCACRNSLGPVVHAGEAHPQQRRSSQTCARPRRRGRRNSAYRTVIRRLILAPSL